jgi:hypothetical protein
LPTGDFRVGRIGKTGAKTIIILGKTCQRGKIIGQRIVGKFASLLLGNQLTQKRDKFNTIIDCGTNGHGFHLAQ